jgi:hypothetical protein
MIPKTVYLCGLISPRFPRSITWRKRAAQMLEYRGWRALIPRDMNGLTGNGVGGEQVPHKRIVNQDFCDVYDCEFVLWNSDLYGETRQSFGSHFELGWAWMMKKKVICIASKKDTVVRNHPFLTQTIWHYVETLEQAIEFIVDSGDMRKTA